MTKWLNSPPSPAIAEGVSRTGLGTSVVDDSDRFDFDHRVGVGEAADLDRRAGRSGRAEIAHPHVRVLGELRVIGHVGIGFYDVRQGGAGGLVYQYKLFFSRYLPSR